MSKIEQIMTTVIEKIQTSQYRSGAKIKSIRAAALYFSVSKNTVVEAYERLVAMGYLQAKRGSGFYVTKRFQAPSTQRTHQLAQAVDSVTLLREQLIRDYAVRIGDGRPPEDWVENIDLGKAKHGTSGKSNQIFVSGYGNPWGYFPLRERIAQFMYKRHLPVHPDKILLTHSANHAMDLVARQLLQPGDVALVDSPGYYPLFGKLKFSQVQLVGVRRQKDGPDTDDLAAKIKKYQPKIFFTQSLAHNPTGSNLSLPVAHRILKLADAHGMYIVEDDAFADILNAGQPRLAVLDQFERVIYIGTFSKTLSAAFRVGYITANKALIRTLCDLKMLTLVSTSDFVERVVCNIIDSGQYSRHLNILKNKVKQFTAKSVKKLKPLGVEFPYGYHGGGYYLWAQIPNVCKDKFSHRASQAGIFLAPGHLFRPDHQIQPDYLSLRINVAYATDPRFLNFIAKMTAKDHV